MANSRQLHDRKAIQTIDSWTGKQGRRTAGVFAAIVLQVVYNHKESKGGFSRDGAIDRKSRGQGKRDPFEPGAEAGRAADRRGRRWLFRVQLLDGVREPAQHARQ